MAKYRAAKGRKGLPTAAPPQAIGCIIVIVVALLLLMASVYFTVVNK